MRLALDHARAGDEDQAVAAEHDVVSDRDLANTGRVGTAHGVPKDPWRNKGAKSGG